ncbi:MAG: hypothetical protein KGJ35_01400 [Patescibacteria group bacterium]|nr:hypothetical protein [Patescibacteria group bacterium]
MTKTYHLKRLTWIDIENPTPQDIAQITSEYKLHPLVARELAGPSKFSRAVSYKNHLYLVLQFPVRIKLDDHHVIVPHEIDFLIGKDFVITVHYQPIQPLYHLGKAMETNAILDRENSDEHAGHLLYIIVEHIYDSMRQAIGAVNSELTASEDSIFSGNEKEMVTVISNLSRELLDFRQICRAHFETLESLESVTEQFLDQTFTPFIIDIKKNFAAVRDAVVNGHELAKELRETNDSLLSTKQNETIKFMTVVTSVTFPLSLFVELFSMDSPNTPIVSEPYGFFVITGIVVVVVGLSFWYFRRKKWL